MSKKKHKYAKQEIRMVTIIFVAALIFEVVMICLMAISKAGK